MKPVAIDLVNGNYLEVFPDARAHGICGAAGRVGLVLGGLVHPVATSLTHTEARQLAQELLAAVAHAEGTYVFGEDRSIPRGMLTDEDRHLLRGDEEKEEKDEE